MMFTLDAMANVTFRNILGNVLLHVRPPELLSKVLVHLGASRMNGQRGIMSCFHDMRGHIQVLMLALVASNH